ncbi:hypothetical protein BWZ22_08930 [Seonamhaeicola sp. S2-3]|uniref:hypothetical protein n=1 Tax=Seonamhaeicola sp. S2-3 TaxID=1936081 RepID=UPI000972D6B7|nr:hypothetical protein [Seonamhaeicola sp. S2-3]APY11357.1 hypothetical protein BWZ22_08930 [Seonamhaeicola sp. S2-3]
MKKLLLPIVVISFIFSCSSDDLEPIEPIENEINPEETGSEETFPEGSLNNIFSNALISDKFNNIKRKNPIKIVEYDNINHRIKTNYASIENLLNHASNGQSWFVIQRSEASTVIEIENVDLANNWITLGKTYLGKLDKNVGAQIEFFNPFVNYSIINNRPLFSPYPTQVTEGVFNYIQPGGIIEKSDGTYILLTPIVFGSHTKRSIYYATSNNLEDWTFHNEKILSTDMIPFAKTNGNVFSTNNPYELENGNFLVLLGVQQPNNNYTSAYMIIDENLNIIQQPKEIMIPNWHGENQNSFPLSITKFENKFRILFHRRNPLFIDREIHEIVATDLFGALDNNQSIESSNLIHKGTLNSGYLRGKADDASYLQFNSKLYILLGSEEVNSNYLTSNNREYGLMNWNEEWSHDSRSPLLINPVQLYRKYPIYNWAWDHLGGFVSPIIKNGNLYIYMAFGTDNPDYYISGIKIPLN